MQITAKHALEAQGWYG